MDLFQHAGQHRRQQQAPLAARMRPRTFDEFVGQEHLVGPGRALRRAIEADRVPSMVLWGPPGSGKTTLALLIASLTQSHVEHLSAVTAGVADLRRVAEEARRRQDMEGRRTILFVDEVHRFNKAQQDVVLPHVEDGTFVFIGATTENPSFEVVAPLLSRCRVFTLHQLDDAQVALLVERALGDAERGLGAFKAQVEPAAMELLLAHASGDARVALTALEMAVSAAPPGDDGARRVTQALLEEVLQRRAPRYDKAGEMHYDVISAFIKSVRGSDPDAALYYLARMLEAGEDPLFIARRIIILAAEDVGLADPMALPLAVACQQAVHFIGLPEGAIPLAEATVYLATAPKSNSAYAALRRVQQDVRRTRDEPVPLHLRNAVTRLMEAQGYGKGYKYAHDHPGHFVVQQFLPEAVKGHRYYYPTAQGREAEILQRVRRWWGERFAGAPPGEAQES